MMNSTNYQNSPTTPADDDALKTASINVDLNPNSTSATCTDKNIVVDSLSEFISTMTFKNGIDKDEHDDNESLQQPLLVPDYLDNEPNDNNNDNNNNYGYNFHRTKQKVLRTLYGINIDNKYDRSLLMDKSPKGSIDDDIRSLVDLINAHPSFATLSSCSGRTALFDPNGSNNDSNTDSYSNNNSDQKEEEKLDEIIKIKDSNTTTDLNIESNARSRSSGKGCGKWLIASHGIIDSVQLFAALNLDKSITKAQQQEECKKHGGQPLIFKYEPFLLHIAASNQTRAHQLLTLALENGLRESGTIQTTKRITVAIRSQSLSLCLPLAYNGPLRPNDEYLKSLVDEANSRHELNKQKLLRFTKSIENHLFRSESSSTKSYHSQSPSSLLLPSLSTTTTTTTTAEIDKIKNGNEVVTKNGINAEISSIPQLNLWGHAAIVVPLSSSYSDNHRIGNEDNHEQDLNPQPKQTETQMDVKPESLLEIEKEDGGNNRMNDDVKVIVFGGFGISDLDSNSSSQDDITIYKAAAKEIDGVPDKCPLRGPKKNSTNIVKRSNKIFSLIRVDGLWGNNWTEIQQQQQHQQTSPTTTEVPVAVDHVVGGFQVNTAKFTAREGHSACILPLNIATTHLHNSQNRHSNLPSTPYMVAAIFGGRKSPTKPMNELLLYTIPVQHKPQEQHLSSSLIADSQHSSTDGVFYVPKIVGDAPSPRWGHTFTSLSGKNCGRLAVVIGGRNENSALPSVHILSCCSVNVSMTRDEDDETTNFNNGNNNNKECRFIFKWETLCALEIPRFHHSASLLHHFDKILTSNDDKQHDTVLVFGGLQNIGAFGTKIQGTNDSSGKTDSTARLVIQIGTKEITMRSLDNDIKLFDDRILSSFGASSCTLGLNNSDDNGESLQCELICGGVNQPDLISSNKCASAESTESSLNCFTWNQSGVVSQLIVTCFNNQKNSNACDKDKINFGSMVHHTALTLPCSKRNISEAILIGGGALSFAFGPSFAR